MSRTTTAVKQIALGGRESLQTAVSSNYSYCKGTTGLLEKLLG